MGDKSRKPWNKKQKRIFWAIETRMDIWSSYQMQIRKLELTTADGGNPAAMRANFHRLLKRIGKTLGYCGIDYIGVQTAEGNGVIHVFVAWAGRETFWIDQDWLSDTWLQIHGASIVWVKAINSGGHRRSAASYVASQYVAGQSGAVRLFTTRRYANFSRGCVWRGFRASAGRYLGKSGIAQWRAYLSGETVNLADGTIWNRENVSVEGPPSSRVPIGPFIGDGERWRVPPGELRGSLA